MKYAHQQSAGKCELDNNYMNQREHNITNENVYAGNGEVTY